ncbi:hypothetical protein [Microbacterium sp. E-13]|uniref:hypothetical protein n=1 Tax=Microbacterium sp. E-13 TaxID=3404048 RepID=UPI003CF5C1EF
MNNKAQETVTAAIPLGALVEMVVRQTQQATPKRGFSKKEAAHYLGLSEWALDDEVRGNRIAAKKRGTTVIFDRAELDRFFDYLPERV